MREYQKRLVDELKELEKGMKKFQSFIHSPAFDYLSPSERDKLHKRMGIMMDYATILRKRIDLVKQVGQAEPETEYFVPRVLPEETLSIRRSEKADTRTCDPTTVSKEELLQASQQHIQDVAVGLRYLISLLQREMVVHDYDKISDIDRFFENFKSGFKEHDWWDDHRAIHRHHLSHEDGVPADVNLIDVLAYIVDCTMAGKARSGKVKPFDISEEVLMEAFHNTVSLLDNSTVVIE